MQRSDPQRRDGLTLWIAKLANGVREHYNAEVHWITGDIDRMILSRPSAPDEPRECPVSPRLTRQGAEDLMFFYTRYDYRLFKRNRPLDDFIDLLRELGIDGEQPREQPAAPLEGKQ